MVKYNKTEVYLGEIPNDQIATASFMMTNVSDKEFTITNFAAGCGCTTSNIVGKNLQPGETLGFEIKVDKRNEHGFISKSGVVTCSNPWKGQTDSLTVSFRLTPKE